MRRRRTAILSLTMDFEIKRWILPVLRQSPRLTGARTQSQAAAFLRGSRHPDAHIRWITFECAVLDVVCGTTPVPFLKRQKRPLADEGLLQKSPQLTVIPVMSFGLHSFTSRHSLDAAITTGFLLQTSCRLARKILCVTLRACSPYHAL